MRVVLQNEYFNPDWDRMGEQPTVCERVYVDCGEPDKTWENPGGLVGPFPGCSEAHEWVMEKMKLRRDLISDI